MLAIARSQDFREQARSYEGGSRRAVGEATAVSVSIGMTALREGEIADAAIKRDDDALLAAKRSGRNRRLTA